MVFSILFSYMPHRCFSVLFLYLCLSLSSGILISIFLFPLFSLSSVLSPVSYQSFLASTTHLVPDSPPVFLVVCHTFLVILPKSSESSILLHKRQSSKIFLMFRYSSSNGVCSHLSSQLFDRNIFL